MMAAVIWLAAACLGVVGSPRGPDVGARGRVGLARRAARAPSARPVMDGGGFELARREVLNGLASSMVLGDFFGRLPFFRRDAPARGRATTARIPDVPEYYSSLPPFQRRITPEGLVLRSVPTTCPPVNALTQDVLRLDVIRQLPPATCETLAGNEPFWVGFERGIATVRETLANSPPLLRLFVSDDLARPTDRAVSEVRAALDSLSLAAKARDVARASDGVLALALKLETLARFTVGRFPYAVPRGGRFETLPRLLGRADATLTFKRVGSLADAGNSSEPVVVHVVLDGYSAPLSAGNFADLALRGFYNGLPLYDGLGLQANKSAVGRNALGCGTVSANVTGFVNPYTGDYRVVPLEYKGAQAAEPVYVEEDEADQSDGATERSWGALREAQAQNASAADGAASNATSPQLLPPVRLSGPPSLPFEVDGVLGLFHPPGFPDDASSQFFWLANPERDGKRLNGRYSAFAVVVGGYAGLLSLRDGDILEEVKLDARGAKLLKRPGRNPQYALRTRSSSTRDYNMLSAEYLAAQEEIALSSEVPLEGSAPNFRPKRQARGF